MYLWHPIFQTPFPKEIKESKRIFSKPILLVYFERKDRVMDDFEGFEW